ncbi:MAG: hypothetical protein IKS49_02740 [Actinomycetaceae bacterium]|nr:hypothetical protein [Actinomycetaceae bacterium]
MAKTKLSQRTYGLPVNPKIGATIFYSAFALYTLYILIGSTGYEAVLTNVLAGHFDLFHFLRLVIWGLLGIKLLLQRYKLSHLLVSFIFIALFLATWHYAGRGLEFLLFIAAGQSIKVRRLAQIALPLTAILVVATLIGSFTGVIDNVQIASDLQENPAGRNSLGFEHPNTFGSFIFAIVLAWLVINYRTINIVNTVIVLCGAVVVFAVSESETYTIAILLAGLLHICSQKLPARLLASGSLIATAAISAFSFYAMFTFDPKVPWWNTLDSVLSHRLTLARHYFHIFPNTLFGQSFESTNISWFPSANGRLVVDNVFSHLWLQYGIVSAVVFLVLLLAIFVKSFRENRWNEASFGILLFVIVGFAEATSINFSENYFLIAASALIFGASLRSLEMPRTYKTKQSSIISGENPDE